MAASSDTSTAEEMLLNLAIIIFTKHFRCLPEEEVATPCKHHFQIKALLGGSLRHLHLLGVPGDHGGHVTVVFQSVPRFILCLQVEKIHFIQN